jgi:methylmalonyl-CoA mutase
MPMMAQRDPWVNMLRTTVAAFGAGVGGADTVLVAPFDAAIPGGLPGTAASFARRIARNTQLVMASESHVGFVADPASGSGAIEALTDLLCEQAWREFQSIESEGGILRSLASGQLQRRISEARDKRAQQYRDGTREIVGTTLYRQDDEKQVGTLPAALRKPPTDGAVFCERLASVRIDELIGAAS